MADRDELTKDVAIDPQALDVEWLRQSDLFMKWAERAIAARFEADRLKLKAEVVEAEVELTIRKNPKAYDITDRVTEAAVKATVAAHRRCLKAHTAYLRARDEAAMLDKAVTAMEIKKRALEKLVELHGQQYFSSPSGPRDLCDAYTERMKRDDSRLHKRQVKIVRKRRSK